MLPGLLWAMPLTMIKSPLSKTACPLELYIASDNTYIRKEYNRLRLELAEVLRELETVRSESYESSVILSLDTLKLRMKENDFALNNRLEDLIRKGKISSQQATSLMNDSSYVYNVTKNIVNMGEILFSTESNEMKQAEQLLRLEEHELDSILQQEAPCEPKKGVKK